MKGEVQAIQALKNRQLYLEYDFPSNASSFHRMSCDLKSIKSGCLRRQECVVHYRSQQADCQKVTTH
jgi:hypothetical protein